MTKTINNIPTIADARKRPLKQKGINEE